MASEALRKRLPWLAFRDCEEVCIHCSSLAEAADATLEVVQEKMAACLSFKDWDTATDEIIEGVTGKRPSLDEHDLRAVAEAAYEKGEVSGGVGKAAAKIGAAAKARREFAKKALKHAMHPNKTMGWLQNWLREQAGE